MESIKAIYKPGYRASDYAPIHGMLIYEYVDTKMILQLTLYSPSRLSKDSLFAWAVYDIKDGQIVFRDIQPVIFDEDVEISDQRLPDVEGLGIVFYKKLTDGSV